MPDPIQPVPSHDVPAIDPDLARSLLAQLAQASKLGDDEYAYLYQTAAASMDGAKKVKTFLESDKVSPADRFGFYAYINQQTKPDEQHRIDYNLGQVGGLTISPEDLMLIGRGINYGLRATSTVAGALKGAASGAAPIIKYEAAKELTRHGLRALGTPEPLVTPTSMAVGAVVAGMRSGKGAAADEAAGMTRDEIRTAASRYGVRAQPENTPRIVRGADGRPYVERPPIVTPPPTPAPEPPVAAAPAPAPVAASPPPAPPPTAVSPVNAPIPPGRVHQIQREQRITFSEAQRLAQAEANQAAASTVVPTPAATPPAATNRLTVPPATFNPADAFSAVRAQFDAIGVKPLSAELTNAMEFMRRGNTAEEAVAKVIAKRPPMPAGPTLSPSEELAAKLANRGAVSDADVIASVTAKNARVSRAKGGTK